MITIKNTQKKINLPIKKIRQELKLLLKYLDYIDFDLGIWFTTNRTIKLFNKKYRHKNTATDILSFAYHPDIKAGTHIKPKADHDKNIGDLIISAEYVKNTAIQNGIPFDAHLQHILVHGICHLLGYDHSSEQEFSRMNKREKQLLKILKK